MSNIRNQRTTHPRKQARRQRAAERFAIKKSRADRDEAYLVRKLAEAASLGVSQPLFI